MLSEYAHLNIPIGYWVLIFISIWTLGMNTIIQTRLKWRFQVGLYKNLHVSGDLEYEHEYTIISY
jgi:hypothetical protein